MKRGTSSMRSARETVPEDPVPIQKPDIRGRTSRVKTLAAARRLAARIRRKDWIRAAFGTGEAAAFLHRAARDRLTKRSALARLRRDATTFRNKHDLDALTAELCRWDGAGAVMARAITPHLLAQILPPRKGGRHVR
jgi:hypothetical protein